VEILEKYLFFWGHQPKKDGSITKSCFSQWFEAGFTVNDDYYPTAEHYMMAEKARLFADEEVRVKILAATHPSQVWNYGREVKNFDQIVWEEKRLAIVVAGNLAKFQQNPALKKFLLSTGDLVLVEASPQDKVWGIGLAANHPDAAFPEKWPGLNLLGIALMKVRNKIAASSMTLQVDLVTGLGHCN
jgi:ribA/ribD-fused uncharacterized protein